MSILFFLWPENFFPTVVENLILWTLGVGKRKLILLSIRKVNFDLCMCALKKKHNSILVQSKNIEKCVFDGTNSTQCNRETKEEEDEYLDEMTDFSNSKWIWYNNDDIYELSALEDDNVDDVYIDLIMLPPEITILVGIASVVIIVGGTNYEFFVMVIFHEWLRNLIPCGKHVFDLQILVKRLLLMNFSFPLFSPLTLLISRNLHFKFMYPFHCSWEVWIWKPSITCSVSRQSW